MKRASRPQKADQHQVLEGDHLFISSARPPSVPCEPQTTMSWSHSRSFCRMSHSDTCGFIICECEMTSQHQWSGKRNRKAKFGVVCWGQDILWAVVCPCGIMLLCRWFHEVVPCNAPALAPVLCRMRSGLKVMVNGSTRRARMVGSGGDMGWSEVQAGKMEM